MIGKGNILKTEPFDKCTNYWYFGIKLSKMGKNTSVSLGSYFDEFIQQSVSEGRFKNASEVIRAGLRLLEDEEQKARALKNAIQEGLDSGIVEDFDFEEHLKNLNKSRV